MKKFLSLLLTAALLLSLAAPALADEAVTINVLAFPNVQSFFEGEDENNNYMINWIKETVGFDVHWSILPSENTAAKRNAMMASSNPPDIVMLNDRNVFLNYYNDGLLMPLNEYLPEDMFQNDEQKAYKLGYIDGQCYAIATPGKKTDNTSAWWYNKEMLTNAGIELPEHTITLDQFTEILYALKKAYPDSYPLSASGDGATTRTYWLKDMEILYAAFGIANDFRVKEDGTLEYALATDDMKECFEYLNKLYADGILDPEYLVNSKDNLAAKMLNGNCASALTERFDYTQTYRTALDIENTGAWDYVNIIDGGKATCTQTAGNPAMFYLIVSSTCKHPEEAVKLLQLMLSNEYYDMAFYGYKDVDWYYDENGNRQRNLDSDISKGYLAGGMSWFVYYYVSETFEQSNARSLCGNPNFDMEHRCYMWVDTMTVKNPIAALPLLDTYSESFNDITDVTSEYGIKFVMGGYSFDQWDEYLSDLDAVGLEEMMVELNDWYKTVE